MSKMHTGGDMASDDLWELGLIPTNHYTKVIIDIEHGKYTVTGWPYETTRTPAPHIKEFKLSEEAGKDLSEVLGNVLYAKITIKASELTKVDRSETIPVEDMAKVLEILKGESNE